MTLKQRRLIKAIPKSKSLWEAGEKAGYSKKARNVYKNNTKHLIARFLDSQNPTPEEIVGVFSNALVRTLANADETNHLRAAEDLARIKAMFISKVESKVDAQITEAGQSLIDSLTHSRTASRIGTQVDNDNSAWDSVSNNKDKPIDMGIDEHNCI